MRLVLRAYRGSLHSRCGHIKIWSQFGRGPNWTYRKDYVMVGELLNTVVVKLSAPH